MAEAQMDMFSRVEEVVSIDSYRRKSVVEDDDAIIEKAISILDARLKARREGETKISSPDDTKAYLRLRFAALPHEVFVAVLLDHKHRVIKVSELFRGTVDSCSVHAREVVKEALSCNAAAVVFAHNHPSGPTEPSRADRTLTENLKKAMSLIGVRTLDHVIVGEEETVSFAERGLLY
jgi:DNA repair protein RadC